LQEYDEKITRAMLVDTTTILAQASDKKRLQYLEAIFIIEWKPYLNVQSSSFNILPSNIYKKNKKKTVERQDDARIGAILPCSSLARPPSDVVTSMKH
jgi:hypothetical protein